MGETSHAKIRSAATGDTRPDGRAELARWSRRAAPYTRLSMLANGLQTLCAIGFAAAFAGAVAALADGRDPTLSLGLAALFVGLRAGLGYLSQLTAEKAGERLVCTARQDIMRLTGEGGPTVLDGAPTGERIAQLVDRTALLAGHTAQWLPGRMAAIITPVLVLIAVFTQSWLAGVLILVSTLMLPVFIWLTASETAALARAQQASLDALAGVFETRTRIAGTIRAFNAVTREADTIHAATGELARKTMAILRVAFLSTAVLEFFSSVSIALVAVYVGFKLLGVFPFPTGEILTLREGLMALILAPEFFAPIRQLSSLHHARSDAAAAAESLAGLTNAEPSTPPVRLPPLDHAPTIDWQAVALGRGGHRVLDPVTATARAGEITVLWGPSGSGKTTLLLSLLGLAETLTGQIRVDGAPLETGHSLAASAAYIGQRPWAVEGSVRDNLRLAGTAADDEAMCNALVAAGCDSFLGPKDSMLDVEIGAGGAGLSGGELQRLAIARALVGEARLLLLDEPSAHLDESREQALLATLRRIAPDRTILVASHSAAVRQMADRIIALETDTAKAEAAS